MEHITDAEGEKIEHIKQERYVKKKKKQQPQNQQMTQHTEASNFSSEVGSRYARLFNSCGEQHRGEHHSSFILTAPNSLAVVLFLYMCVSVR